jgi:hypothetical protein
MLKNKIEEVTILSKGYGKNELAEMREQLCSFVTGNFDLLYFGACRLGCNIEEDFYARRRIQTGRTRLHERDGLKIAGGHHIRCDYEPEADNIREAAEEIQRLLDAASKEIKSPFRIEIIKTGEKCESNK